MKKSMLVTAALTFGFVSILAPTAAQAGNPSYCDAPYVCVYKNSNYDLPLGARTANFPQQNISAANRDEVSSWENITGSHARWYTSINSGGSCHNMKRYSQLGTMSVFGQNDNMESWAGTGLC